jgi:hypothetical protein
MGSCLETRIGQSWTRSERFYSIQQIEFCRNFIFKRNFPIHKIFQRSCEMGLWEITANKISEIFGCRLTKKLKGKLHTTLEQIEGQAGERPPRAYNGFLVAADTFSARPPQEVSDGEIFLRGAPTASGHRSPCHGCDRGRGHVRGLF